MTKHIPFVNSVEDCELAGEFFADSPVFRLCLDRVQRLRPHLPDKAKIWIDPSVDGFHRPFEKVPSDEWKKYVALFTDYSAIADPASRGKPNAQAVGRFVVSVLDACQQFNANAITIPQLPHVNDASRNKINRLLASAAGKWKAASAYRGNFILPVIFTDQQQLNLKTARTDKRRVTASCYEDSGAAGVWIVDSSLSDQAGSPTFRKRFGGIMGFHEELNMVIPDHALKIAGPYWGLNLVLWARGLCNFPAIGIGKAFQYHIAGGQPSTPKTRIAIPVLRRWAIATNALNAWLEASIPLLDVNSEERASLELLHDGFVQLMRAPVARRQIARFYKEWYSEIEKASKSGRALALFQDLSAAYVLGKLLPTLPATEKTARRPERVAELLMLTCL